MEKCQIDDCDRKHKAKGMCEGHYGRVRRNRDVSFGGAFRPVNKGVPSYNAIHQRLYTHYGVAKQHDCAVCFAPAHDWALIKDMIPEGEIYYHMDKGYRLPYSIDLSHYLTLCRHCHYQLDHATSNEGVGTRAGQELSMS